MLSEACKRVCHAMATSPMISNFENGLFYHSGTWNGVNVKAAWRADDAILVSFGLTNVESVAICSITEFEHWAVGELDFELLDPSEERAFWGEVA